MQAEVRGSDRIPIHGGKGPEGVFNVVDTVDLKPQAGWTKVQHGAITIGEPVEQKLMPSYR